LTFGLYNFVNLAKREKELTYMPSLFTLDIGKLAKFARGYKFRSREFGDISLRTAHRSSINARYSIDALPIVCVFAYRSCINARYSIDALRIVFAGKDSSRQTPSGHTQTPRPQRLGGNKFAANIHPTHGEERSSAKKLCRSIIFFFAR
jgi:hypothetical protein